MEENNSDLSKFNQIESLITLFDFNDLISRRQHLLLRKRMPSMRVFERITEKAWNSFKSFIEKNYDINKANSFKWETRNRELKKRLVELIYLNGGLTVFYDEQIKNIQLVYDVESNSIIQDEITKKLKELQKPKEKDEIGFLIKQHGTLDVNFCKYKKYENSVISFLGDDIQSFYTSVVDQLTSDQSSGLYLLYGEPGTGKTSFIKTIISEVDRKTIFVTPSMAEYLDSPDLIGLLADYSGSILIIEDAEKILMKRELDNSNAVSTILNLTDGFPADFLNLNIICTFNTEITEIDPALVRKGRLKGMQEFKKLITNQARNMAKEFGLDVEVNGEMTLADIWNSHPMNTEKEKRKIGFGSSM